MHRLLRLTIIMSALASGGYLMAQEGGGTEPAKEDTPEATVPMEKQAEIAPAKMTATATQRLEEMNATQAELVKLQQAARKDKDVIKLNCVNDKLLQVKQLINIAETANEAMQTAINKADEAARYHEYGRITIAAQQTEALEQEARECVGDELVYVGPTVVDADEVTPPDVLPQTPVDIEPPAYASPFL